MWPGATWKPALMPRIVRTTRASSLEITLSRNLVDISDVKRKSRKVSKVQQKFMRN
ncbi:hypothetical protein WN55_09323 [Dufourea novaeangliae]|uniref:Uncharacterized protein n=1 Tax=Dufourea novaeangliae TaxID=178035 RepID=A0A154P939_DUFNO|nr:hypothetical protein WN55_09323 [Dufourea novaeangliae]